jgi:hypothetical protein
MHLRERKKHDTGENYISRNVIIRTLLIRGIKPRRIKFEVHRPMKSTGDEKCIHIFGWKT